MSSTVPEGTEPLEELCDLPFDGAKGGLKRGNTAMMIREGYDGRKD
jgi:hypothetical protein